MSNDEVLRKLDELSAKINRMWTQIDSIKYSISSYIGRGNAFTYLGNDNIIFVNADDIGGPSNFIDGGKYEIENVDLLCSFLTDHSVMLDIGANLGFFSLVIGDRMRRGGKIIAFEPQPAMVELFKRSCYHSGLDSLITIETVGLSNQTGVFSLWAPRGHTGGATLGLVADDKQDQFEEIQVQTVRLDDFLPGDFACDLVKIDVEGHELEVLKGMSGIVGRSPNMKVLFEKLGRNTGIEDEIGEFFQRFDMEVRAVEGANLSEPLNPDGLRNWQGYVLAANPAEIDDRDRRRFTIYPNQLMGGSSHVDEEQLLAKGMGLLAHGPYWHLPRGCWKMTIHGDIRGRVTVAINEKFGHPVVAAQVCHSGSTVVFIVERDLTHFECVFRGALGASVKIDRLVWSRLD